MEEKMMKKMADLGLVFFAIQSHITRLNENRLVVDCTPQFLLRASFQAIIILYIRFYF